MTGTNFDLRTLRGLTSRQSIMIADGTTKSDIFTFNISGFRNVSIATAGDGAVSSPFSLALFRDVNNNGTFDNSDLFGRIRSSDSRRSPNEANESLNVNLTSGVYFAEARAFALNNIGYILRATSTTAGTANPLTTTEIQIGQISQDLRNSGRVNDSNTADNFAFTLDGSSSLDIKVRELGKNKKGDVNVRVVQDLNNDGVVNRGDRIVRGTSTDNGNLDTISGLTGAGDYILQVCQTSGSTQFRVNFDHSVA